MRSSEEQAAFDEQRRELAHERARCRHANPAIRAARAQAIRQQQEDPEVGLLNRCEGQVHAGQPSLTPHFPGGEGLVIFLDENTPTLARSVLEWSSAHTRMPS